MAGENISLAKLVSPGMTGMVVIVWEELAVNGNSHSNSHFYRLDFGWDVGLIAALIWAITEKSQVVNFRREVSRLLTLG